MTDITRNAPSVIQSDEMMYLEELSKTLEAFRYVTDIARNAPSVIQSDEMIDAREMCKTQALRPKMFQAITWKKTDKFWFLDIYKNETIWPLLTQI